MKVWLVNEGENLPGDDNNPRLQRMGLLAYELEKLVSNVTWWQSTFNHYQKKFRYHEDINISLTDHLELKLLHSCGYKKNVSLKRIFHEWKTAYKFYKQASKEEKPNVIVSAMPTIAQAFYCVKFGRKNNIPVIIDFRDLNPDVFVSPFKGIIRFIISIGIQPLKWMLGWAAKHATGLVGTTQPYLDWGLSYAKREQSKNDSVFFVSYPDNGIATNLSENSRWKEYLNYDGIICCFFGQFGQLVDFDTLIETAEICKKNEVKVKFLLCGKGELLNKYQNIVENKKLDNVISPGWVNQTDIADIGYISDVGLMAYKKNDNFDMQMPNKFSEYLSLGLQIMLQPEGIMKTVVEDNECGIHYENSTELYDALKKLSCNDEILQKMKRNSRKLFEERFSAGNVYKEYGEYIISIAKEEN